MGEILALLLFLPSNNSKKVSGCVGRSICTLTPATVETHKPRWFRCTRSEYPAYWCVMICTDQCRPASACALKSPPRDSYSEGRNHVKSSQVKSIYYASPHIELFSTIFFWRRNEICFRSYAHTMLDPLAAGHSLREMKIIPLVSLHVMQFFGKY